jgi:hypothetical protein
MRNRVVVASCFALLAAANVLGQAGTSLIYQGRLSDAGAPANGSYDMTFRVFDAARDGNQYGKDLGMAAVPVTDGLFSVLLDFGAGVFTAAPRWLEVEINGQPLSPRQDVAGAPFAQTCNDATYAYYAAYAGLAGPWDTDGASVYYNYGNVGIGTSTPGARLEIAGEPGVDGILFPDGTLQTTASGGNPGLWQTNGSDLWYGGGGVGVIGGSSPFPLGKGVFLEGGNPSRANVFAFDYDTFQPLALVLNAPGGNVGIGTIAPSARLHVAASGGNTIFSTTSGGRGVAGWATSAFGGIGVSGDHTATGNYGLLGTLNAGVTGVAQVAGYLGGSFSNLDAGGVALEVTQGLLDIKGTGNGTELLRFSTERPWVFRQVGAGSVAALQLRSTVGQKNFEIAAAGGTNVATFWADDAAPRLVVNGTTRTKVLEISGADVAEKFATSERCEPGTVMEIDPDNPGHLRISRSAYNQRVAGVVSGANDLPAGAILGNLPGSEDATPIALSGRVWTYCDASQAAIAPGDLLTTSGTAGHAMKVIRPDLAHGAVIGKAMTPLESGRGLVLVLVNLQ